MKRLCSKCTCGLARVCWEGWVLGTRGRKILLRRQKRLRCWREARRISVNTKIDLTVHPLTPCFRCRLDFYQQNPLTAFNLHRAIHWNQRLWKDPSSECGTPPTRRGASGGKILTLVKYLQLAHKTMAHTTDLHKNYWKSLKNPLQSRPYPPKQLNQSLQHWKEHSQVQPALRKAHF